VGEVTTTVVAFLFMFDFSTFPGGLGKKLKEVGGPKNPPLGKHLWQRFHRNPKWDKAASRLQGTKTPSQLSLWNALEWRHRMLIRLLPIGHQGALWADLALDIRRAGIWERGTSLGFHTMTADTDRRIGQADDNVIACQS